MHMRRASLDATKRLLICDQKVRGLSCRNNLFAK